MNRTLRVQVGAIVLALAGAGLAASRIIAHEDGQPFGWKFFAGCVLAIVGGVTLGNSLLHAASDREAVYRLGYAAGRLDAIRDINRHAQVVPLRPAPDGLHSFNRAAAGRRARRPHPAPAPDERADTPL